MSPAAPATWRGGSPGWPRRRAIGAAAATPARVVVIDYNAQMIAAGRARRDTDGAALEWVVGDAQRLPLPGGVADGYCISFGSAQRHRHPRRAPKEARRVLRPGGRFLCLEFSRPPTAAVRRLYDAYSFRVIPRVGQVVARDRDAYQYLVESIRRFPDQATLASMMTEAGFGQVSATNFSGGVCALHQGWAI